MISNADVRRTRRESLMSFLHSGETHRAMRTARLLLDEESSVADWMFIRKELERAPKEDLSLKSLKVALLSSFSSEFLHAPLIAYGLANGLSIEIYQAGFGQFQQEILNPESGLYAFGPDVVILSVEGKDWAPAIYRGYVSNLEIGFGDELSRLRDEITRLVNSFRARFSSSLLVHNFAAPIWPQMGILDWRVAEGQNGIVQKINDVLIEQTRNNEGVYLVDYASLVNRFGAINWYDDRMAQFAGAPIRGSMLPHLVVEYMKFFRALSGQTKKCLVVDLDDTLWGGIVGEVGPTAIHLGPIYPGSAFVAFQEAILNLQKRGVLLAVASKNNQSDVDEVFAGHPHMVLKKEDFSALKINWQPKSQSLSEIAQQLNIDLEHLVFVDDNPVECEEVAIALPMVRTLCLPKQPEYYVRTLMEEGLFDGLSFSAEDLKRGALYQQRDQAESLRAHSGSLEDFYRNLEMKLVISRVTKSTLSRTVQLTQKTNQITVTTFRYNEADIKSRMADSSWLLATVAAADRFGDNGIVGVMMARFDSEYLDVDTLLLSCRVAGRTVETAMLAYLCESAVAKRIKKIRGRIIPTPKNMPARDIYASHGFRKLSEEDSGETFWLLDVPEEQIHYPAWMEVSVDTSLALESDRSEAGNKRR